MDREFSSDRLLSPHRREEHVSDSRDGGLEAEVNAAIHCLGEHNLALLGEHIEATEAAGLRVSVNALNPVVLVNHNVARDLLGALIREHLDLLDDHVAIFLDNLVLDLLNEVSILLAATDEHVGLEELDETLQQQVLEEFLVAIDVLSELVLDGSTSILTKLINVDIDGLHSLDSTLVLLLRLGDLDEDLMLLEVLLGIFLNSLLGRGNELVLLDGVRVSSTGSDSCNFLAAVLSNELDHVLEDLLAGVSLCHIYFV